VIDAVVFDMDGVLIESEEVWDAVREAYVRERDGRYDHEIQRAMMGMSSHEWSRYLHETAGVPDDPDEINAEVVHRMLAAYREHLPLIDGAADAVRRLALRYPLAVASSSNRPLIDTVLEVAGLKDYFKATVSSEEVARGKPAPDVYLETARRLGLSPECCAAIEDSHSGIRSASAAGMYVVAIPNASYPPDADALAQADVVIRSLDKLTAEVVSHAGTVTGRIATAEPDALALRMARHFSHKVPVTTVGSVTHIETRVGRIELEPAGADLVVTLVGDDVDRLREVAMSHLERFARGAPISARWL
jgi:HAD superfamily hydrolase (TIGR01509 family)